MELRDSRRLTGPNVLWRRPSAVIDVGGPGELAGDGGGWGLPVVAGGEERRGGEHEGLGAEERFHGDSKHWFNE